MKQNTLKGLIVAAAIATLALGGGIAGTFALFSRTATGTVHIKVGNINFNFKRTKVEGKRLDEQTGRLVDFTDTTVVNLSQHGDEALEATYAVPGCEYLATYSLENTGKVAFTTHVAVVGKTITKEGEEPSQAELEELETYTYLEFEDQVQHQMSEDNIYYDLGDQILNAGETLTFTMKVTLDELMGNDAQDLDLTFDLQLTCTQYID